MFRILKYKCKIQDARNQLQIIILVRELEWDTSNIGILICKLLITYCLQQLRIAENLNHIQEKALS